MLAGGCPWLILVRAVDQVRADIERQCALVAEGKATKEQVVAHSLEVFAAKFKVCVLICVEWNGCGRMC